MKLYEVRRVKQLTEDFAGRVITFEEMTELEEDDVVEKVEHCGASGYYPGRDYYTVYCIDGTEFAVYL